MLLLVVMSMAPLAVAVTDQAEEQACLLAGHRLVYVFIDAGRLTNADTGLVNGTILALGTFTWRLVLLGTALGLGTAAVAYIEQYRWILFALALLALGIIIAVTRMRGRAA